MREVHKEDYDEIEEIFMEAAASNPALGVQLAQHEFPAKFAYEEGHRLKSLKEMGDDPVAYIEKVKVEAAKAATEAVHAELAKIKTEAQKANIPESLAEANSASNKELKDWSGPKPIKDILDA